MFRSCKRVFAVFAILFMVTVVAAGSVHAKEMKIGYVDLRRAFYEYGKTKTLESDLESLTAERQDERAAKISDITQLRDEIELLTGNSKTKKQREIEVQLADLQRFDRDTRASLLNTKNEIFRTIIDEIQSIVKEIAKDEGYDYILDSRNIMYSSDEYDVTDQVLEQLNR